MSPRDAGRQDDGRGRLFAAGIVAVPIGRPRAAARIGGTESRAGPETADVLLDSTS